VGAAVAHKVRSYKVIESDRTTRCPV